MVEEARPLPFSAGRPPPEMLAEVTNSALLEHNVGTFNFRKNIVTLLISTFIYFAGYAWYEYFKSAFLHWQTGEEDSGDSKAYFALLVTIVTIAAVIVAYAVRRYFL